MTDLKPCPFCGGDAELSKSKRLDGGFVENKFAAICDCPAFEGEYFNPSKARHQWNTRPLEDALKADLERVAELGMKAINYPSGKTHNDLLEAATRILNQKGVG